MRVVDLALGSEVDRDLQMEFLHGAARVSIVKISCRFRDVIT
jgi:hypothetical protein